MAIVASRSAQKKVLLKLLSSSVLGIALAFIATQLLAADLLNPYEKNYKAQNSGGLKSLQPNPDTKMYVSNHKDEDNISMLESGYDLMGTSGFEAGDISPNLALQYGKAIQADTVLVYSKYGSAKAGVSKIQAIKDAIKNKGEVTEKDLADEETQYKYFASYWAKLPTPLMGVHVIKLVPKTESATKTVEKGLKIIAVIKDSPAAKAGIVRGDMLLKIGEVDLITSDDLFAAVKRYQGQSVPVEFEHEGAGAVAQVALNKR